MRFNKKIIDRQMLRGLKAKQEDRTDCGAGQEGTPADTKKGNERCR